MSRGHAACRRPEPATTSFPQHPLRKDTPACHAGASAPKEIA